MLNILNIGKTYRNDTTVGRAMQHVPRTFYDVDFEINGQKFTASLRVMSPEDAIMSCVNDIGGPVIITEETQVVFKEALKKHKKAMVI